MLLSPKQKIIPHQQRGQLAGCLHQPRLLLHRQLSPLARDQAGGEGEMKLDTTEATRELVFWLSQATSPRPTWKGIFPQALTGLVLFPTAKNRAGFVLGKEFSIHGI